MTATARILKYVRCFGSVDNPLTATFVAHRLKMNSSIVSSALNKAYQKRKICRSYGIGPRFGMGYYE